MLLLSQVSILLTTPVVRIIFAFKVVILIFVFAFFSFIVSFRAKRANQNKHAHQDEHADALHWCLQLLLHFMLCL